MATQNTAKRTVKTADTVFTIIETLLEMDGAGVTEIADRTGLAKSTVHGHLSTLHRREYVVKDGNTYRIGLKFLDYGMQTMGNREEISDAVQPVIEQVAQETSEVVWFVVEEHGRSVFLMRARGDRAVPTQHTIGYRTYLHDNSGGKAILAHMSDDEIRTVIDRHGLPRRTKHTITDPDELFEQLEQIREQGVAFCECETIRGVRSVGAPVFHGDDLAGSICVIGPTNRLRKEYFREEIPDILLGAANEIELKLSY
ncbi:MAG: IclR family transcriptional regulator [Salinigranum sp.]